MPRRQRMFNALYQATHPRTREILSHLKACRLSLRSALAALSASDRNRTMQPDGWWAAELLEHLILVEGPLERFLTQTWLPHVKAGALGPETEISTILGADSRWSKPECLGVAFEPRGQIDLIHGWRELEVIGERLQNTLFTADGRAWSDALLGFPSLDKRMSVCDWAIWIGRHEEWHAADTWRHARERDNLSTPSRSHGGVP